MRNIIVQTAIVMVLTSACAIVVHGIVAGAVHKPGTNDRKLLTQDEIDRVIAEEVEHLRRKRAIPAIAVKGLAKVFGKLLVSKLKSGSAAKKGSSPLVKKLTDIILAKTFSQNAMKDIHHEVSRYLDDWQKKSSKSEAAVSKKLKTVIDSLVKKNSDMLKTKTNIDIIPQKGMQLGDMFAPPGYKIQTSYSTSKAEPDSSSRKAYAYDSGIGNVILNGCYKPSFTANDPCHATKRLLPLCDKLLEGATFIGVGFDGRGTYSSSSRRKSVIQRICLRGGSYDRQSVPDSMTVHGIYDTDVETMAFSSMTRYQRYLEKKAAVAKSGYMFLDDVRKAYGKASVGIFGLGGGGGGGSSHSTHRTSSQSSMSQSFHSISQEDRSRQMYMSMLQIDVVRYEIFMDDVKPHDLNMDFLHDLVSLPTDYFSWGAAQKYQNFVLRYGTHYIKSAKFGGSLRLFKVKQGSKTENIEQFSRKAQADYSAMFSTYQASVAQFKSRSLFHKTSGTIKKSTSKGGTKTGASESKTQGSTKEVEQQKYSNEVLTVEGGDQKIAAVISEMYTVGFKHELVDWLQSIPTYPKPIEFQMAMLSDLCNINYKHLFPAGVVDFGCFGQKKLQKENGTNRMYYTWDTVETNPDNTTSVKTQRRYCDFTNQQGLQDAMMQRCRSLRLAINIYLQQGPYPVYAIHLPAGLPGCETNQLSYDDRYVDLRLPTWDKLIDGRQFRVIFDMLVDIPGVAGRSSVLVAYFQKNNNRWYVKDADGVMHLYDGWGNGGSDNVRNKKISLRGLVLSYDTVTGLLHLSPADYTESLKVLPDLSSNLTNKDLARVEYLHILHEMQQHKYEFGIGALPCNVVWTNIHRFKPMVAGGSCISFSAISAGDIFIVFAAIPRDKTTWYYVQISPNGVAIYKGLRIVKFIDNKNARGIGDKTLFQVYFVCVEEDTANSQTVITYGKTSELLGQHHVYGVYHDTGTILHVKFYAFGTGDKEVEIMDSHVMRKAPLREHICVGDTISFKGECIDRCHPECFGCHKADSDTSCSKCRHYKLGNKCVATCPSGHRLGKDNATCSCNLMENGQCVSSCSGDRMIVKDWIPHMCKCKYFSSDNWEECLPYCPLTTYSLYIHTGQTMCKPCHAVCKRQYFGMRTCTGPEPLNCIDCYTVGNTSRNSSGNNDTCIACGPGFYLDFSQQKTYPTCRRCPLGFRCPGDGRKYACSIDDNRRSTPSRRRCERCPPGTYSTVPASDSCHRCETGFYQRPLSTRCILCPPKTAGRNCRLKCKCKYGRCIKGDGSCTCWRFFKGRYCEIPMSGALRLVADDRNKNSSKAQSWLRQQRRLARTGALGRLEVYKNGKWWTVCSHGWSKRNSIVACSQFYMKYYKPLTRYPNKGPILTGRINCSGNEKRLLSCPREKFVLWKAVGCPNNRVIHLMCL